MARTFSLVLALICLPLWGGTLEVVKTLPHSGYSEGLHWHEGYLWHALPKEIVKIDPKDGSVVARFKPATEYSESLMWWQGSLWNVSYSDNGLYEGKLGDGGFKFERRGSVPEAHAWGIEFDGTHVVVTGNYSTKLYFLNAKTFRLERTVETTMKDIEDLAWDGTGLWASSYTQHPGTIFRIDPKTGKLSKFFSLPKPEACPVVDGLAYDGRHLWLTGKHCPSLYQVKIPSERLLSGTPDK